MSVYLKEIIYEDSVLGRITAEQFQLLSASYTDEQAKLTEALPRRETEIQRLKDTVSNTAAFLDKAKRYTDIQALTPELLRLFIQKIVVHIRTGDYFPDLKLTEETRPIGKWGRMHRDYLKEYHPIRFNNLVLSGNLWTYLADMNEQAQQRLETLVAQLISTEGITEALKAADSICWTQQMNNIVARAEAIVREELIYNE